MRPGRQNGYFLIEAIAYVAILAIVLNVAAQVLLSCTRLTAYGTGAADGVVQRQELEDAFRGAVREAFAVVPEIGAYRTDRDTVVLEMPSHEGRRFAVAGRPGEAREFAVLRIAEVDGILEVEGMKAVPLGAASLEMAYDAADPVEARLITLRLVSKAGEARTLSSALRGKARVSQP